MKRVIDGKIYDPDKTEMEPYVLAKMKEEVAKEVAKTVKAEMAKLKKESRRSARKP